jgi:hypothetical protein
MDNNSPASRTHDSQSGSGPEVHNSATDEYAALLGGCGQVHLASGKMCDLRHAHEGSCEFTAAAQVESMLAEHKAAGGW